MIIFLFFFEKVVKKYGVDLAYFFVGVELIAVDWFLVSIGFWLFWH